MYHETRHVVAILDLLGASEQICSANSERTMSIMLHIFTSAKDYWHSFNSAPDISSNIKFVTFSDNIAMALKLPNNMDDKTMIDAIKNFIIYISVFQGVALFYKLLFRGGIAIGNLYINQRKNFIWGKALVDAHILEEKSALYPRVVLSHQLSQLEFPDDVRILKDFDGLFFVDYLTKVRQAFPEWIYNALTMIQTAYAEYSDNERILQKYSWLKHHIEN